MHVHLEEVLKLGLVICALQIEEPAQDSAIAAQKLPETFLTLLAANVFVPFPQLGTIFVTEARSGIFIGQITISSSASDISSESKILAASESPQVQVIKEYCTGDFRSECAPVMSLLVFARVMQLLSVTSGQYPYIRDMASQRHEGRR